MPLTQYAPICLILGFIMVLIGEVDGRGCQGGWHIAQGAMCIRESKMEIL